MNEEKERKTDRVLGDEWLDWKSDEAEKPIAEGKRTFLMLSFVVLLFIILLSLLFLYLVLPRFEQFGRAGVVIVTVAVAAAALFLVAWFAFLLHASFSTKNYLFMCLERRTNLLTLLFPLTVKLATSLGISKDRLSHSFIKVSNRLVPQTTSGGTVLALLPRCLKKELKQRVKEICGEYPDVMLQTAPGGNVARKIIQETKPRAIVAVACERDLVSGIQDVAPRIPVIGICNTRPSGPCKDTSIDIEAFRSALEYFCNRS
ncbi:MAG TPA: DUF116 domain-containing protein [Candidatus Eisenbacteria bacterium]|uniref:DUF116 domain-containing protein n=1 Tax=Eiseniibacteriota bacterium TaxID=2212470 RepID=A0A7V2F2K8_UNCEI|nr:DUF116 domain-containing protein [Candidatus Eisenbacteria bacterium]